MNRRNSIKTLLSAAAATAIFHKKAFAGYLPESNNTPLIDDAYLMAHFKENDQKLYYAYSTDARNWTALNNRKPVFDPGVNLRDPFIGRAKGVFHLVHTKGWDFPVIHHYQSADLINWDGGEIKVVTDDKKRAWAPEWIYSEADDLFYLFWASDNNGHNSIFYTTTKDWKNIDPEKSAIFYDIGIDDIDLTIIQADGRFQGFHKAGKVPDDIWHMVSPTLDPKSPHFGFGKPGNASKITTDIVKPIEGPEVIKLNNQQKWHLYADPFYNDFIAWETVDFKNYKRIAVSMPRGAKHCSMLSITNTELNKLLNRYPV
jgi:hypothetical protein